jgi:hypothetical protein
MKQAEFYKAQGEAFKNEFMDVKAEYKFTNSLINSLYDESDEDEISGGMADAYDLVEVEVV